MGKPSRGSETTSKADKKFEKKLQFYAKVRDTVASLSAKKEIEKKKHRRRQKKLKAYDLSALNEFLPDFNVPRESAPAEDLKLNCKKRQQLILKEGRQLGVVLNHPAFQADPLGSIHQHLLSTQPVVEEKPKKKNANKNGSQKRNRKKGKASSEPQSMDM